MRIELTTVSLQGNLASLGTFAPILIAVPHTRDTSVLLLLLFQMDLYDQPILRSRNTNLDTRHLDHRKRSSRSLGIRDTIAVLLGDGWDYLFPYSFFVMAPGPGFEPGIFTFRVCCASQLRHPGIIGIEGEIRTLSVQIQSLVCYRYTTSIDYTSSSVVGCRNSVE